MIDTLSPSIWDVGLNSDYVCNWLYFIQVLMRQSVWIRPLIHNINPLVGMWVSRSERAREPKFSAWAWPEQNIVKKSTLSSGFTEPHGANSSSGHRLKMRFNGVESNWHSYLLVKPIMWCVYIYITIVVYIQISFISTWNMLHTTYRALIQTTSYVGKILILLHSSAVIHLNL